MSLTQRTRVRFHLATYEWDPLQADLQAGLQEIVAKAAEVHGVTPEAILSRTRGKVTSRARQDAMLAAREILRLSYPDIGRLFDRDHKTVMHGCDEARARREARRRRTIG